MKEKFINLVNKSKRFARKHSPEILTGLGITGMISSTILAVKATPKAVKLIEEEKERQNDILYREAVENNAPSYEPIDSIKPIECIKTVWKLYLPSIGIGLTSIACIIYASKVNYKRNAALATAYSLSERTLTRYREKVIDTIGEKKEKTIRDKIAQDEVTNNKVSDAQIVITEKGNTLFRDEYSGRYFKSDIDTIKRAVNKLNRRLNYENYISLNEFYGEIGLNNVKNGDVTGWNICNGLIEPSFSTCLTEDDQPCIVLDFMVGPGYDYDKII